MSGDWATFDRPVRVSAGVCIESDCDQESEGGGAVTSDLISRARAGDGDAFRALTEPYRRELHVHCYRMLGSYQDAEDALQDTLFTAWRGLDGFEGRASIRTWLYRIATNRCLNARRAASRRPAQQWDLAAFDPPEPTRLGEVTWLEPIPDALLGDAMDVPLGPEARYEQTESISLAVVTALQVLPPRQLASVSRFESRLSGRCLVRRPSLHSRNGDGSQRRVIGLVRRRRGLPMMSVEVPVGPQCRGAPAPAVSFDPS